MSIFEYVCNSRILCRISTSKSRQNMWLPQPLIPLIKTTLFNMAHTPPLTSVKLRYWLGKVSSKPQPLLHWCVISLTGRFYRHRGSPFNATNDVIYIENVLSVAPDVGGRVWHFSVPRRRRCDWPDVTLAGGSRSLIGWNLLWCVMRGKVN